ncbi:MAG: TusE/DsrC/DsvC family sulfur relay protein [Gammaproteobacteria bacterium]|nr:MAG: TusE/DsrC/DsvC family sulfur relay protein [Gammaproteobacteria bacterium]
MMNENAEDRALVRQVLGLGGNLDQLDPWDEEVARRKAAEEGLELTEDHWTVLHFLRAQYDAHGDELKATKLIRELSERFKDKGGKKYLYELFPKGPISQGSRIAGIPAPEGADDPHFGSVH